MSQFGARVAEPQASVDIVGDLAEIHVDPQWRRQSLWNLAGNSLTFQNDNDPRQVEIAAHESDAENDVVAGRVDCKGGQVLWLSIWNGCFK